MHSMKLKSTLLILSLTLSTSALGMSEELHSLLAGIDTVPTRSLLLENLDDAVAQLEAAASNDQAPLYHRIRATSFLSTLNADGGRESLLRLCDDTNPEIRRHAVYGLLRSTDGTLSLQEWTKITTMLQTDATAVQKDIVRGFRWSKDQRSLERLTTLTSQAGPLKSLAIHVLKRRNVLFKAPLR